MTTLPLFIIAGPPGAGKATIAPILAKKSGYEFFEGGSLISDEDKAVMSSGSPLSKAAHLQWMINVIKTAHDRENESSPNGIVVTCNALKKEVRALLQSEVQKLNEHGSKLKLIIIWCNINKEESDHRTANRKGRYYNPALSDWIFARIEIPCVEGPERKRTPILWMPLKKLTTSSLMR